MVPPVARQPLVSVITPTWARHGPLIDRCVASVASQSYQHIEHIIVSDGPDEFLSSYDWPDHVGYYELPEHAPSNGRWGTKARLLGIEESIGDLICYLDDDDRYRTEHVAALADALIRDPNLGFAYSYGTWMSEDGKSETGRFGTNPPSFGGIGTGTIMNRRETLRVATWRDDGGQATIDWDLAERWLHACIPFAYVDAYEASVEFIQRPDSGRTGWR
jgi:glycosyltransferase involved in cell wall biosynthesis